MANEIHTNVSLSVVKGGAKANRVESVSIDMSGDSIHHGITSIATGGTQL